MHVCEETSFEVAQSARFRQIGTAPRPAIIIYFPKGGLLIMCAHYSRAQFCYPARRIINYAQKGVSVIQGDDAGFIKFGSRLDMFLPLNTQLDIKLNDLVKGGVQIIGHKN